MRRLDLAPYTSKDVKGISKGKKYDSDKSIWPRGQGHKKILRSEYTFLVGVVFWIVLFILVIISVLRYGAK